MSCPYLAEITMTFCRAYPVKKLVPADRPASASRCDGEAWFCCPAFREAAARAEAEGERAPDTSPATPEGGES